jgi:hypothetical protein
MKTLIFAPLILLAALLPAQAQACTIPVFRYALEKWDLTRYDILVYQRGPRPAKLQATLKAWDDAPNKANLDITTIDLDGKVAPKLLKLWQREGRNAETPWMLVRYHDAEADAASAWSGPCSAANLKHLADSPMRQALRAHLTRGSSCVFVLLTSDDAEKDETIRAQLQKNLAALEKKIKLPVQAETDLAKLRLPLPIKVSLPLLVLDRGKPDEAAFVKLLLATEAGLDQTKGPIVFPIFGRGRVLCSLAGAEIEDKLSFVTEFLCAGCSCDVKNLNPGIDMLMLANWNEIFDRMYEAKEAPKEREAEAEVAPKTPTLAPVVEPPSAPTPTVAEVEPACFECPIARNWHWIATGFASVLVVGAGAWSLYLWRKSST